MFLYYAEMYACTISLQGTMELNLGVGKTTIITRLEPVVKDKFLPTGLID